MLTISCEVFYCENEDKKSSDVAFNYKLLDMVLKTW